MGLTVATGTDDDGGDEDEDVDDADTDDDDADTDADDGVELAVEVVSGERRLACMVVGDATSSAAPLLGTADAAEAGRDGSAEK